MSKLIYTSYSPNTRSKDLIKSIFLLFSPTKWMKGNSIIKLKEFFSLKFNTKNIYLFNHARTALYLALRNIDLKEKNEVMIQGFTCVASVNPVIWAGGKPIFVDINPDTLNINYEDFIKKVSEKTRVVIFQHTFGKVEGIDKITDYCKKNNIVLIEDCAHMIGSKYNGKLAGTFGDISIFSLGRDKSFSSVDGGVLIINNESINQKFLEDNSDLLNQNTLRNYPPINWIIQRLLFQPFWSIIKFTYPLYLGKIIHKLLSSTGLLSRATTPEEKLGKFNQNLFKLMPNSLAELALTQLEDFEFINSERQRKLLQYNEKLANIPSIKYIKFNTEEIPLRLPFFIDNPNKFKLALLKKNIVIGDWYDKVIAPKEVDPEKFGYIYGSCPLAESICEKTLNFPLHINISDKDINKIIKSTNEILN